MFTPIGCHVNESEEKIVTIQKYKILNLNKMPMGLFARLVVPSYFPHDIVLTFRA